jgi:hypothetical protein
MYFADSTNSVALRQTSGYQLEYLLGLLNSRLYQWRFKLTSTNNNVGTNELESMPFRNIDFESTTDREYHRRMVMLVGLIQETYNTLGKEKTTHDKTVLQRQINATDRQIDQLVYELYGLTQEEVALIEASF